MTKSNEIIKYLNFTSTKLAEIKRNQTVLFGYRERMLLEQPLFLLINQLCIWKINYEIKGFSSHYKEQILDILDKNQMDSSFRDIINNIFSLRSFLKQISNENAYVRGDTLSKVGIKKSEIIKFIEIQLRGLERKIYRQ